MISRETLRKYEGMEPEEIAAAEGLEVMEVDDMPPRIDDMLCLGTIVIRKGLGRLERCWRIAHCLGHHFLHSSGRDFRKHSRVFFKPREEREADVFAGFLVARMMSPSWANDLYSGFEPWRVEPWELVRQMIEGMAFVGQQMEAHVSEGGGGVIDAGKSGEKGCKVAA